MCRIAGIASLHWSIESLQQTVAAMCHALRHGGPDDEGLYTDAVHGLVLGHRRLSLIDLSKAGHQPMQYADGRYTISYNGEIYNFAELRLELKSLGCHFHSTSDTEVILAAFATWGTAAFARFNGMFALALLDQYEEELYLVRDLMGIKPLYYLHQNDSLVFASEVRAFYQLPQVPEEHPNWPVYLMAYGHLPEPVTTLKDVIPLPKGSFMRYNLSNGTKKIETFDTLRYFEKETGREEVQAQIRTTLKAAVKQHLLSDAPIGVFLSGGIDSSIVALLAAEKSGRQLNTLSLYFNEEIYSEKTYQDSVLEKLSSNHFDHRLTEGEFHYNLPEIIKSMDLPCSDGINTWFISSQAKKAGLKAVLSGLGGDELFGGYPSFKRMAMTTRLQSIPNRALKAGRYTRTKKLRRLTYLTLEGIKGQYLFLRGVFVPSSIARYLNMNEEEVWDTLEQAPVLPDVHHLSAGNRASWMEMNLYMQNQLLRDADVMSMAHGIELRVPFLDKSFVKLVLSFSSAHKYSGDFGKQLLVDSFRDRLPATVWQRKKMGFSFPFAEWLKEDEWVRSKMRSGGKASLAVLQQFSEGRLHWSGLVTTLLLRTHHYEAQPAFFNA